MPFLLDLIGLFAKLLMLIFFSWFPRSFSSFGVLSLSSLWWERFAANAPPTLFKAAATAAVLRFFNDEWPSALLHWRQAKALLKPFCRKKIRGKMIVAVLLLLLWGLVWWLVCPTCENDQNFISGAFIRAPNVAALSFHFCLCTAKINLDFIPTK